MTKRQITVIMTIIFLPVLIGVLFFKNSAGEEGNIPFAPQQKKIGLVKIIDVIYSSEEYVRQLQELRKDKTIAGIILRVNSPGGGVAPSQEIYSEMMQCKNENKPVVVSMGSVAASGGYYIACPATKIFASPGTITGSIGVIFQFPHYYELLNKIGVKMTTIKSGEFKDVGNPNRDLTEKEKKYLQMLIDNTYEQFIRDVCAARNMKPEELRKMADGRIFTGEQAAAAGLIDTLGSYSDAISYLRLCCSLPEKTKMVEKRKQQDFLKEMLTEGIGRFVPFFNRPKIPPGCYFLLENF